MYLLTQGFSEAESFDTCCRLLVHRLNWGMRITGAAIAELSSDGVINELGRFGLQGSPSEYLGLDPWDKGPLGKALAESSPLVIPDLSKVQLHKSIGSHEAINKMGSAILLPITRLGVPVGLAALVGPDKYSSVQIPAEEAKLVQGAISLALRALRPKINPTKDLRNRSLTQKEQLVISWIAKGKTNKEIAPLISLSLASVKKIVQDILRKLDAKDRHEAVGIYFGNLTP